MKTKLFILAGIGLAVASGIVMAEKKDKDFIWQAPPVVVQGEDESKLLPSLQGIPAEESAYLDDDKAIYVSRPNDPREKISRRKIADNVEYIFDQQDSKVLFAKGEKEMPELWIADKVSGSVKKLGSNVSRASFSPSGDQVAVYSVGKTVHLLAKDGGFLKKIGANSAMPIFSPDGKLLAYYKLGDSLSEGGEYFSTENAQGIAIYNLETGKERLVTKDGMDYEPVAFSPDGKKLYFLSGRGQGLIEDQYKGEPFQTPLWVVDIVSGKLQQLNNRGADGSIVFVQSEAILSSDGLVMISESDGGISMLAFNQKGEVSSAKILATGTNPRWLKKDEIITYLATGLKGKYWEFVSLKP